MHCSGGDSMTVANTIHCRVYGQDLPMEDFIPSCLAKYDRTCRKCRSRRVSEQYRIKYAKTIEQQQRVESVGMNDFVCTCGELHTREFWSPQAQRELRLGRVRALPAYPCDAARAILKQREAAMARIKQQRAVKEAA